MIPEKKIDKLDLIKMKNFCSASQCQKMRRQATGWENAFPNDTSAKGWLSQIYKELLKLNYKKTKNLIKRP